MTEIIKCGWDVGIKHLAYCIIKKKDNNISIEKWSNIDLTDSVKNKKKCCGILKNKNQCSADAKFYCEIDNVIKYYCGSHKTQNEINVINIEKDNFEKIEKNNDTCNHESINNKKCIKKAEFKLIDKDNEKDNDKKVIYCKTHKDTILKKMIKEMTTKPIKKEKSLSSDIQGLCEKMYDKLSEIEELNKVNEYYIENQPTHINPVMKTVSTFLFSYFVNLSKKNNESKKIKFVSPGVKITIDDKLIELVKSNIKDHDSIKKQGCKCRICKLAVELNDNETKSGTEYTKYKFGYDSIKELGIIYTKKILIDNKIESSFDLIEQYDKKDDVCDAFLHAYKQL